MKQTGVLFKPDMIGQIDQEIKTMTRRIVKGLALHFLEEGFTNEYVADRASQLSPFGYSGDQLYIKESYLIFEPEHCEGMKERFYYKTDHLEENEEWRQECIKDGYHYKWHSALFMKKIYARYWVEITDLRIELLQDISKEDAVKEGIKELSQSRAQYAENGPIYRDYSKEPRLFNEGFKNPVDSFRTLWCHINGKESWDKNPFVWVVSFKKIAKP